MCLRVAYNDAFRMIHGPLRHTRTRVHHCFFNVLTFDDVMRKPLFNFVKRSRASINALVYFYESKYFHMYCSTEYEGGTSHDLVKN